MSGKRELRPTDVILCAHTALIPLAVTERGPEKSNQVFVVSMRCGKLRLRTTHGWRVQ